MKVSELAKEYDMSSDEVLKTLKSLKLKAKDSKQELSAAVVSVVKSALKKSGKTPKPKKKTTKKKTTKKKTTEKKTTKKKTTKKKTAKKKTTKKKETKKEAKGATGEKAEKPKKVKKKLVRKKVVRKEPSKKAKKKISKEPMVAVKPLPKKRKKQPPKESQPTPPAEEKKEEPKGLEEQLEAKKEALAEQASAQEAQVEEPQEWKRDESLPDIEINVPITVKDLSTKLGQKSSEVLKHLMKVGVFAHINQSLDGEVVNRVAQSFGYNAVKIKTQEEQLIESHEAEKEDKKALKDRAPVVTFMGHVDHGKTTLLDKIRKSKVADLEHGGITQHIGAYSVEIEKGKITFLDTPGHEAFTSMRARGAHITDLVVVVIAADEGIMPQTEEAIDHARAADVPIVVALTKIDKKNADPDNVKRQLQEHDLQPEDWGGKTTVTGVSGITGEGVDELLELILLESELLELQANPDKDASGIVVEAHMSQGKGAMATFIVQSGTLKEGDTIVVGPHYGKIKAMFDDHGRTVKTAGPSTAVEILGLADVPEAGEMFYVVEDERSAKEIAFNRSEKLKDKKLKESQKVTLEDLYSQLKEGEVKELSVIIKADVQGSLEALKDSLSKIPSNKVKIKFIHTAVGDVNSSDVLLAQASNAIIIAFHVGIGPKAQKELEKDPVDVRQYRIIYDAVDDMRKALEGLLEAKTKKHFVARAEVREVFKLSRQGIVAGCYMVKGKMPRKTKVDVIRDDEVIFSGSLSSLKRFKDDVKEVNEGMECGIQVEGFSDFKTGDIIEAFSEEKIAQKL